MGLDGGRVVLDALEVAVRVEELVVVEVVVFVLEEVVVVDEVLDVVELVEVVEVVEVVDVVDVVDDEDEVEVEVVDVVDDVEVVEVVDSTPHWDGNRTACIRIPESPSKLEAQVVAAQRMADLEVVAPVAVGQLHILGSHVFLLSAGGVDIKGETRHLMKRQERRMRMKGGCRSRLIGRSMDQARCESSSSRWKAPRVAQVAKTPWPATMTSMLWRWTTPNASI